MMARVGLIAGFLAFSVVSASADMVPVEPPPPPSESSAPDPAWQLYDEGFRAAAQGDLSLALAKLRVLSTQYPRHPAAQRGALLIATMAPSIEAPAQRQETSNVARGELVFWSTLSGAYLGANVCNAIDCDEPRTTALVYSLTVGGALGASVIGSRFIHNGQAQLYNSAQAWTAWNTIGILNGLAEDNSDAAIAVGMQGLGVGLAAGLWEAWHPTAGDVALTNSFFIWGTLASVWTSVIIDSDSNSFRKIVIAGDASILIGALVSTQVKMSRGRTLLIDTGGILGFLIGGAIAIGVDSTRGLGAGFLAGEAIGVGGATLLSAEWDAPNIPQTPVAPTVVQTPGGRAAPGLGVAFQW